MQEMSSFLSRKNFPNYPWNIFQTIQEMIFFLYWKWVPTYPGNGFLPIQKMSLYLSMIYLSWKWVLTYPGNKFLPVQEMSSYLSRKLFPVSAGRWPRPIHWFLLSALKIIINETKNQLLICCPWKPIQLIRCYW